MPVFTREQEREMVLSPDRWPARPVLPMKRYVRKGPPECGIIVEGHHETLFINNMFTMPRITTYEEMLLTVPHLNYGSVDELLDAGWIVD